MEAIPLDQPFLVRGRYGRQALLLGGVVLLAVVGSTVLVVWMLALGLPVGPVLAVLACPAALCAVLVGFQVRRLTRSDVLLAAGPVGLWFRSDAPVTGLFHLPWEQIERVSVVHWRLLDRVLVVTPRHLGRPATPHPLRSLYGDGYRVRISLADTSAASILAALDYYSGGRCVVG